jgi:hypothetical protein
LNSGTTNEDEANPDDEANKVNKDSINIQISHPTMPSSSQHLPMKAKKKKKKKSKKKKLPKQSQSMNKEKDSSTAVASSTKPSDPKGGS